MPASIQVSGWAGLGWESGTLALATTAIEGLEASHRMLRPEDAAGLFSPVQLGSAVEEMK